MSPRTPGCCTPRRLHLLALVLATIAGACGPSSEITTGPSLVKCEVSLTGSPSVITADGGTGSITVATNPECVWTAASQASWINGVSPQSGQGNGSISFSVTANASTASREGQIVVNDAQLRVQQQPASCQFTVSPVEQAIAAAGGTGSLNVATLSGCSWNASASDSWITIESGASGSGNGVVRLRVSANTQAARSGIVSVGGQNGIIEQDGAPLAPQCTFTLSSPGVLAPAAGAAGTVTLQTAAGCAWSATSTVSWVGITAGASGNATGVISFAVSPNTGAARTGTLRIAGQTYTISQAGVASCAFSIAPTSQSVGASGGTGTPVAVTTDAGCAWSASSQVPWITITSGAGGNGPGTTQFSIDANSGGARTGTLTIAGHAFTVTQAAAATPCAFSINPSTQSVAASGGAGTPVAITTATGCAWTATSNASWLTITSATSGNGPGTIQFSIAANTGGSRSGTLTIAGQTFTVTQAAAVTCSYSIKPDNQSIGGAGGSGTIAVGAQAGCAWTAVSHVPWVTVTSGASGSGSGTTQFAVAANNGGSRTGTLTVAGQTFTVTQAAACSYSLDPTSKAVNEGGGNEEVKVKTQGNCAWTATSNVPWIQITSGASDSGNGDVKYHVDRNLSEVSRTGTLTIAGLTFTVTQRGEK